MRPVPDYNPEEEESERLWYRASSRREPIPIGQGSRDVRMGCRWLPWHFTAEFEQRMKS